MCTLVDNTGMLSFFVIICIQSFKFWKVPFWAFPPKHAVLQQEFSWFFHQKIYDVSRGAKTSLKSANYVLYVFCSKIIIFSRYTSGTYFFFDFKKKIVFWNFSWNSAGFTTGYWSKNEIFLKSKIKRILHVSHVRKSILWLWKLYWVILSQKI